MSEDQGFTGNLEKRWISDVISSVRNVHPSTDPIVFTTFEELLQTKLSDRELTPSNLKEMANALIQEFVLITTKPEVKDED